MSNNRFPVRYQITLMKNELDQLRYGIMPDMITRAPNPIFAPFTIGTFLSRSIRILTPNKTHSQELIPSHVTENEDSFIVKGVLISDPKLEDAAELDKFKNNNQYKYIDTDNIYQFYVCRCQSRLVTDTFRPSLFKPASTSEERSPVAILQNKTEALIGNDSDKWKYNKTQNTAWLIHDSLEVLHLIADFLKENGMDDKDITFNKTNGKPILLIKNIDVAQLEKIDIFAPELQ